MKSLRACLETTRGAVFGEKTGGRGATKENIPGGSSTEEQRSQTAFSPKTLRAAGLLSVAGVGSFLTARCGDARNSPPWPQPKSLAAAPLVVSKQALTVPPKIASTGASHCPRPGVPANNPRNAAPPAEAHPAARSPSQESTQPCSCRQRCPIRGHSASRQKKPIARGEDAD